MWNAATARLGSVAMAGKVRATSLDGERERFRWIRSTWTGS